MIAAPPRGMSATLVALVCVAGAACAGLLAQAMSDRWELVLTSAGIAGLTGLSAVFAMMVLSRSPQSASAAASPAPAPTATSRSLAALPQPAHGSRPPVAPVATDGESQAARMLPPPAPRPEPEPDPRMTALHAQHGALLNEYRALLTQRATLLRGLAELTGLLPETFVWQAAKLLKEAGAREVMPAPGTPFDPVLHHVLGTEPTPDVSAHDTVAHASRAGWLDRGQVLVPTHVVLYALHEPPEGSRGHDQQ
jgi:hypothetical protein